MTLYHGTNVEFDKIDLLMSKPNKYYFGTEKAISLLKRI